MAGSARRPTNSSFMSDGGEGQGVSGNAHEHATVHQIRVRGSAAALEVCRRKGEVAVVSVSVCVVFHDMDVFLFIQKEPCTKESHS